MTASSLVRLIAGSAALATAFALAVPTSGQTPAASTGVLDEHPTIQYATRETKDRVAKLSRTFAASGRSFERDSTTGYLKSVLEALGISSDSQLLVFSKTGVQRAYTSPHTPRALYFDDSVAVGYVPGAPLLEMAAHDPEQGVIFYTLDQHADAPLPVRRASCLTCHVSASTLNVPGIIVRSHTVGDDGNLLPQVATHDVTHQTGHPDRWGGWLVTSEDTAPPYSQRAHQGNITFSPHGNTSNQIFLDWMGSAPETRGYLSASSDIAALLAFDHQMPVVNMLTRLDWEWRVAVSEGRASVAEGEVARLVGELADYLLFADEAPLQAVLSPRPGFAKALVSKYPKDAKGRSLGQLDLTNRLLRYPCSYMIYSEAFEALPPPVKQAVYRRMIQTLTAPHVDRRFERISDDDRRATLEILRATRSDFPGPLR